MPEITIHDIPEDAHGALVKRAADRRQSLEEFVRDVLLTEATARRSGGIDFEALAKRKAELGLADDWPEWTDDMDDPALSRKVLFGD